MREAIGVALQDVGLDPLMTARELLMLQSELFGTPRDEARKIAERLLQTVGLDDVDPKKRAGAYSGGMKRRLDLALALVHDPRILFLDEPTTGLDPASRAAIWEEVRRLNDELGMTIFLTTQYLEEADRLADEIAIINKGTIVAQGTPEELKREVGDEVVELQFGSCEDAERAYDALAPVAPNRQRSEPRAAAVLRARRRERARAGARPRRRRHPPAGPDHRAAEPRRRVPARHRRGAGARGRRGRARTSPAGAEVTS